MSEDIKKESAEKKVTGRKVLMAVLGLMLCFSTATSAYFLYEHFAGGGEEEDYYMEEEGQATENDVLIDDTYLIEDTTPISDAYKSGDDSKLSEEEKETLKMASEILDEIIDKDMTDLEKETAVYDWMHENIKFNQDMMQLFQDKDNGSQSSEKDAANMEKTTSVTGNAEDGTPYGTLKNRQAVCAGYATTFRLFMQMLDIDCMVCHSSDRIHSWDLVKIDDHWYHVDLYSDEGLPAYGHFNMNDAMMAESQSWDRSYFPKADSLEANPAYQNRRSAKDVYEIPKLIRQGLEGKESTIFIVLQEPPTETDKAAAVTMIGSIASGLGDDNPFKGAPFNGTWQKNGTEELFVVSCYYLEESPEEQAVSNLPEETQQKINESLQEAFGDINSEIRLDPDWM